nr:SurA N-terminal domain-containing protein [Sneathiella chinensis]
MRKGASGWLAKGLLILLVASFAVWGIGSDMLGSSVGSDVIEVGDKTVTIGEFQREYQRNVNLWSQRLQTQLSADQARQFGLPQMTIQTLQSRLLVEVRANQLNLGLGDGAVLDDIRNGPTFRNELGQFDRFMFQQVLRQNGYSENEYVEILRNELKGQQLVQSLTVPGGTAPAVLTDTIFGYQAEQRRAAYVEVLDATIHDVPAPTDEQLAAYVTENPGPFTAPEYRKAVYLSVSAADFIGQVEVTDEELQAEYDGRTSEFQTPEHRAIQQMIFETEDAAKAAQARITEGAAFDVVAQEDLQLSASDIDLGKVTKTDLLDELQAPVFALTANEVSAPIKTVLGWHLVKVTNIEPAATQSLDDVKDQLKQDIALRLGADLAYERSTALMDVFAGGASVEEAAEAVGATAVTTDWIDRTGKGIDGKATDGLPAPAQFLGELFAKSVGDETHLTEAQNGTYYAVAVTEVRDAELKELDAVREQATAAWQADWRHKQAKTIADGILEKAKQGTLLATLSSDQVSSLRTSDAIRRSGPAGGLTPDVQETLFTLKDGEFAVGENTTGTGYIVYGVDSVIAADADKDAVLADTMSQQIGQSLQQDLLSQYETYLEKEIGVSVKTNLIQEYL